ncbi:MAG: transketolase [Microthrixaceae bacterium]
MSNAAANGDIEALGINVIRGLAMDGPRAANSGHQGTAMALAPLAHVLFTRILRYDSSAPHWADRDRFILSPGHASILLYSMLYLTGYSLTLDDIKEFRQWGSLTPGHPERGHTEGVEVTTGPLGQGFANGVGMAMAEQSLRERFGSDVCDHFIHAIVSDGDLEEGVSHEAASLAGHLRLGRMVYVYDDNHVSIDGPTEIALTDDPVKRFEAYGWHVQDLGEASEDLDALEAAVRAGREEQERPSIVVVRSHIGYPSPMHTDDPAAHGLAFSTEDISATKEVMGIPDQPFWVPDEVLDYYRQAGARGAIAREDWEQRSAASLVGREAEWEATMTARPIGKDWSSDLPVFSSDDSPATRAANQKVLQVVDRHVPGVLGGSADLTGNTGTKLEEAVALEPETRDGRQVHYGIREHAMGSALVGAACHGGVLPISGTFLVFSDYMRGAVRVAALSEAKCIFVWSHDSVGVGEDGPTHQPIEHVMSLRLIPQLTVIRPCDGNEVAGAWKAAVEGNGPVAMITSRQSTPTLEGTAELAHDGVAHGAYALQGDPGPEVVLIGTGTEVAVAVDAAEVLRREGLAVRVVSMPSWELFEAQDAAYRDSVLPAGVPTVSVEAGVTTGWQRWAQASVGIDRFGASAPGARVMEELGITAGAVATQARALLGR